MYLLFFALACEPAATDSDATDKVNADDTAEGDSGETGGDETGDTDDTQDSGDTEETGDIDADADGYLASADCDDANALVHPGATETCDGLDENCDGSVDEGFATIALLWEGPGDGTATNAFWYGYDADNNQVLYGGDIEQDGSLNNYVRYEWADGAITAEERSNDGSTPASRVEYVRDADGRVVETWGDDNGDGVWDWSYGYTWEDGHNTGYWYDSGADGDYEYAAGQTYNADGNQDYGWADNDGDGDYDSETVYTYDGLLLIAVAFDNDGDGIFEGNQTNTWDGDRLMEELVVGASYTYRRTYGYTDADNHWDTSDYDDGDNGSIEYRYTATWDDDNLTGQTVDEGADGVDVYEYTYEMDEEGRGTRVTNGIDGVLTSVYEYEYHENGLTSVVRADANGDGTWDIVTEYDTRGNATYQSEDPTADGIIDQIRTWSYDEGGRRTGATTDMYGDGTLQYEQVMRDPYVCGSK